jgi:hypothetical protein
MNASRSKIGTSQWLGCIGLVVCSLSQSYRISSQFHNSSHNLSFVKQRQYISKPRIMVLDHRASVN